MDPQSSPGRLTCHPLHYGLQLQTCEQQLGLERPRGKQRERKEKGTESAAASPWVKQRLHDCIVRKLRQSTPTHSNPPLCFRVLAPVSDLASHPDLSCSSVGQTYSSKQLRRTASEPIQKLKPRRSMSSRKNLFRRKSSAPPTDSCSSSRSTLVSQLSSPSSLLDSAPQICDYSTALSLEYQRNMSRLNWGNVSLSSCPEKTYTTRAAAPTLLSVNILSHPVILPVPVLPMTPPPHLPVHVGVRQHGLLHRTQSLHSHSYRQNGGERPQRSSRTLEPGVCHICPGAHGQEGDGQVPWRDRFGGGDSARGRVWIQVEQSLDENCSKFCGYQEHAPPLRASGAAKHVTRSRSSPLYKQPDVTPHVSVTTKVHRTGLVCNSQTPKPQCAYAESSSPPQYAGRIQSVWSRLQECGLINQCQWIPGRQATLEEIQVVQPESHIHPYGTNPLSRLQLAAVRMVAGSMTELALRVAQGELRNGFAIVTPHGHDASQPSNTMPMSVAIAAKQLQCRLNVTKILIVDWDVHHGNITQDVFYTDPGVLYISLHRHGYGTPNSETGGPSEVGFGPGEGYTVNVAWPGELDRPIGDAEYLTAFRCVVMPIAQEFSPEVVLVSSEFSAVEGHPAPPGGHKVSAKCFGALTRQLMEVARGRVVLALEGGHDFSVTWDASKACISALLDNEVASLSEDAVMNIPSTDAMQSLQKVFQIQSKYWRSLRAVASTLAQRTSFADTEATSALASLSMAGPKGTSYQDVKGLSWYCREHNEPLEHDESKTDT